MFPSHCTFVREWMIYEFKRSRLVRFYCMWQNLIIVLCITEIYAAKQKDQ